MPEGFSVRSPGSWQGGSWVSALLDGVFWWTSSQDLALWFCVSSLFHAQDLLIRRQFMLQSIGAVMSRPFCVFLLGCFVFLGSVWLFVLLFLLLLLCDITTWHGSCGQQAKPHIDPKSVVSLGSVSF